MCPLGAWNEGGWGDFLGDATCWPGLGAKAEGHRILAGRHPPSLHSPKSAIFRKPWASSSRLSNFRSLGGWGAEQRGPGTAPRRKTASAPSPRPQPFGDKSPVNDFLLVQELQSQDHTGQIEPGGGVGEAQAQDCGGRGGEGGAGWPRPRDPWIWARGWDKPHSGLGLLQTAAQGCCQLAASSSWGLRSHSPGLLPAACMPVFQMRI